MKIGVRARFLVAALATWALCGCEAVEYRRTTIEANSAVAMPDLRLSLLASGEGVPSAPRPGFALEFAASGARGGDSQTLATGEPPIVHGGRTFNAPAQLEHRFDYKFASAVVRWRGYYPNGGWGLDLVGGLARVGLDFRVSSATLDATSTEDSSGIVYGAGLMKALRPGTILEGRLSSYVSNSGVDPVRRTEIALVQALAAHLSARVGYSRWRIYAEDRVFQESDIKLKLDALTLGLELHF